MDIEKLKYEIISHFRSLLDNEQKMNYFNKHFSNLSKIKTESELNTLLFNMRILYGELKKEYNKLKDNYSSLVKEGATVSERNKLAIKINSIVYETNILYDMINIIQKSFAEKSSNKFKNTGSTPSKENIVTTSTPSVQTKVGNITFKNFKPEFRNDPVVSEYLKCSNEISRKYKEFRDSGFKDKNVDIEKNKLIMQRRKIIDNAFSSNSKYGEIYSRLRDIETMENDVYSDIDYNKYPVTFKNSEEYMNNIKDSFRKISEFAFVNREEVAQRISNTRFHNNLLLSAFDNSSIMNGEYKKALEISNDIINLITTYNIYGSDRDFVKDNSDKKIATEKVTTDSISQIKKMVNAKETELYNYLTSKLKSQDLPVKINDYYISNIDKEKELFESHFKYCASIIQIKKDDVIRKE